MDRNGISTPLFEEDSGLSLRKKPSSSSPFFGSVRNTLHKAALGAKSVVDHARGEGKPAEEEPSSSADPPRASIESQVSEVSASSSSRKHRGTFASNSAVASLRQHLSSRKYNKRPSILGNVVIDGVDSRDSLDGAQNTRSPCPEEKQKSRGRRYSNFMGSVRMGKRRESARLGSHSPESCGRRSASSDLDAPTEPIDIPNAPPLPLRLDLPPTGKLMPSPFQSSDDGQPSDSQGCGKNDATPSYSPYHLPTFPDEGDLSPSCRLPERTSPKLSLRRDEDHMTPMPGTNLPLEIDPIDTLDDVKEPKAGIRKMRSLNDMLEGDHLSDESEDSTRALPPSSILRQKSMADSRALESPHTDVCERIIGLQTPSAGHRDEATGRYISHDPAAPEVLKSSPGLPSPDKETTLPLRPKRRHNTSDSDWETVSPPPGDQPPRIRNEQQRVSENSGTSSELAEILLRSTQSWDSLVATARAGLYSPIHRTRVLGTVDSADSSSSDESSELEHWALPPPGITAREERQVDQVARASVPEYKDPFERDREVRRKAEASSGSEATTCVQSEDSVPASPMTVQELFYDDDEDVPALASLDGRAGGGKQDQAQTAFRDENKVASNPFDDEEFPSAEDEVRGRYKGDSIPAGSSGRSSPLAQQPHGRVKQSPSRNNLLAASTICHLPQWSDPVFKAALGPGNPQRQENGVYQSQHAQHHQMTQTSRFDSNVNEGHSTHLNRAYRPATGTHKPSATDITGAEPLPNYSGPTELTLPDYDSFSSGWPQSDPQAASYQSESLHGDLATRDKREDGPCAPASTPEGIILIRRDELRPSTPRSMPLLADRSEQWREHVLMALDQGSGKSVEDNSGPFDDANQEESNKGPGISGNFPQSIGLSKCVRESAPKNMELETSLLSNALQQAESVVLNENPTDRGKGKAPVRNRTPDRSTRKPVCHGRGNRYAALAESSSGGNDAAMPKPLPSSKPGGAIVSNDEVEMDKENRMGQEEEEEDGD
ncbi:hypothetical protein MBLNU230_g2041t1 [Neophaeotheca triangularis]